MALQTDGRIVVAGSAFAQLAFGFELDRYNADGTLDTSFNGTGRQFTQLGLLNGALAVAIQTDGRIVAAEHSSNGTNNDFALVRYNADGTLDTSFNTTGKLTTAIGNNGDDVATGVAIQADGRIVAVGNTNIGDIALARYMGTNPGDPTLPLRAAVLPVSRTVQPGQAATAFAMLLNPGTTTATGCSIAPATSLPATSFLYQTTNPATNQLTGSPNTPVDIAAGGSQTFLIAFTPSATFPTTEVRLTFDCANTSPAPIVSGTNTLLLATQSPQQPDVIALAATLGNDGIVNIPGTNGIGVFAVATTNIGAAGSITVRADLDSELRRRVGAKLPAVAFICQTNAQNSLCQAPPAASVTLTMATNATATFAVFVFGSGTVPFDPGIYRVIVSFTNTTTGDFAGATSVAPRTL